MLRTGLTNNDLSLEKGMKYFGKRLEWMFRIVLIVAISTVYSNTLRVPFVFDDKAAIETNSSLRFGKWVWPLFYPPGDGSTVQGRPILNFSLALNYTFGGLDVRGYHLTNIVIHIAVTLVLFEVLKTLFLNDRVPRYLADQSSWIAFFTALIWSIHPMVTESVTYIVQRAESLCGLFYLLTLFSFQKGLTCRKSRIWYGLAILFCSLGMATKEVMVSTPLMVLFYDKIFVNKTVFQAMKTRPWFYICLFSTWLILFFLVAGAGGRGGSVGFTGGISSFAYLQTQAVYLIWYLRLAIVPYPLVFDYGREIITNPVMVYPCGLVLIFFFFASMILLARGKSTGFAGILFFALLAPTSSFIPVITQIAAEHRMYLPLIPLVTLVVVGTIAIFSKNVFPFFRNLQLPIIVLLMVAAIFGVMSFDRNKVYSSENQLMLDTLSKNPGNPRVLRNLIVNALMADDYSSANEWAESVDQYIKDHAVAHLIKAEFYDMTRKPEKAKEEFDLALNHDRKVDILFERGNFLKRTGNLAEALKDFDEVIQRRGNGLDYNERGVAYSQAKKPLLAIEDFTKAIELSSLPTSFANLGLEFLASGQLDQAIEMFSKSINKDPLEASTYTYRGDALYRKRDYKNSLKDYSMAVAILPNAANYAMRAHVHRSLGNFSQAIQDFDSSLEINADAIDLYRFRADCRLSAGDKEGARSDMNLLKKKGGQISANEARIFGIDP